MPKRALSTEDQAKLRRGLLVPGASDRAVHELWNIFHDDDQQISRGVFTDLVQQELSPWEDVTTRVLFDCYDGTQQEIYMVNLRPLLEKLCLEPPPFRDALQRASAGTGRLTPVFYCDEATAGNILNVDKSRKASLFYLSWLEAWHLLKHEAMWCPIACVQTMPGHR